MKVLLVILSLFLLCSTASADPTWYNSSWGNCKDITIDSSMVNGSVTGFPLFINITDSDLALKSQVDGDDIIFVDSTDSTQIDHEIVSWNSASGRLRAYVFIQDLANTPSIKLYYNNPTASNTQNPAGVWDSNYVGVWHLVDDFDDSTSNANHGTGYGDVTPGTDGTVFDGVNDFIRIVNDTGLNVEFITISSCVKSEEASGFVTSFRTVVSKGPHTTGAYGLYLNSITDELILSLNNGVVRLSAPCDYNDSILSLTRVVVTHDGQVLKGFIDGVHLDSDVVYTSGIGTDSDDLWIGWAGSDRYYKGILSDVRISNTARSQNYITTEYNNLAYSEMFISLGSELIEYIPLSTYDISGYITDQNGSVINGATVIDNYLINSTISDSEGYYSVSGYVNGTYKMTAFYEGYSSNSVYTVVNGGNTSANIMLTSVVLDDDPQTLLFPENFLLIGLFIIVYLFRTDVMLPLAGFFYSLWFYSTQIDHSSHYAYFLTASFFCMWVSFMFMMYTRSTRFNDVRKKTKTRSR